MAAKPNAGKPTLTLRCPEGHKLVEVFWEGGRPIAYAQVAILGLFLGPEGPEDRILRGKADRLDVRDEVADRGIVTVVCKCGSRLVSMITVRDLIDAGRTGTCLTDAPLGR